MAEATEKKRLSLRIKSMLVFAVLFVVMFLAIWLINHLFLEKYYLHQQLNKLEETRELLEEMAGPEKNDALALQLVRQCEENGISAVLVRENQQDFPLVMFATGSEREQWQIWENRPFHEMDPLAVYTRTDTYTIMRVADPLTHTEWIECRETLQKNEMSYLILLLLPMAKVSESARIFNSFLLRIVPLVLLVGSGFVFFTSRRIVGPIVELDRLSQKMANLDFSERFSGHSGDEIQTLGENINVLSEKLETTIADFKAANRDLAITVQEKEEENARRQELLANISHELKTPIALVQGYAEGLRDGMCDNEEARTQYIEIILDEANRMNRLIQQLLNLNELESGQMHVERTRIDLTALIREMSEAFRINAQQEGIHLELDLPDSLEICSDALLVEQIMQNYISNAFHYVRQGGLIRISAKQENEGACITVYNEGEPIPAEALDQIWDKFYKVDKARTRAYGGSGIGLSVVKAVTELLGGSCSVENCENGVSFKARI